MVVIWPDKSSQPTVTFFSTITTHLQLFEIDL